MTTSTLLPDDGLQVYGSPLAAYHGTGQLTLTSKRLVSCRFIAGQLENGKTLLLCATPDVPLDLVLGVSTPLRFEGITDDGHRVQTQRELAETRYLPETPSSTPGTWFAIRVGHLEVLRAQARNRKRLVYLLSNVSGVHSAVRFSLQRRALELRPIDPAVSNLKRLEVLRGVLPTAEIAATTATSSDRVSKTIDEVCYLLSLAVGTKVQWISLTEETRAHNWIRKHHYSRVTKRYGVLHVIDPRHQDLADYLRQAEDGRFTRERERVGLTNAVIDTYLDAKAEGDFLQVRALKLVIAVEMLKAEHAARTGASSSIVPEDQFESAVPALKKTLKATLPGASSEQRDALYSNMAGLNRPPFASHLKRLSTDVRLPLSPGELERFVASRNKLVHEGRFYCERATGREARKILPLADVQSEWFWLVHFVDRLFLRSIGYEGPYLDWSTPSAPVSRQLRPGA